MDKKRRNRGVVRSAFTRTANKAEQFFQSSMVDMRQIAVSLELLEPKYNELKVLRL